MVTPKGLDALLQPTAILFLFLKFYIMSKDPAFLFYPGDYLRDTQCLSEACQVAYDRIMCEHMRNICITQEQLNFFTKRLTLEEKNELMFILKKIPDGFQIEWVAESIVKRKEYSTSRSKNRTSNPKKDMLTYVEHMVNENENENKDKILKININSINVNLWENIKSSLFNDFRWIEKFCRDKNLTQNKLQDIMQEFINDIELKEDYKELKELKSHFTNWYNLKNKTNATRNNQSNNKLSPSEGREIANRSY